MKQYKDYSGFYGKIYVDSAAMDYAVKIDYAINIAKSGLTPEQAAKKYVPQEWRKRAIAEYLRWQQK